MKTEYTNLLRIVVISPLAASLLILIFGKQLKKISGFIATLSILISFSISLYLFITNFDFLVDGQKEVVGLFIWIPGISNFSLMFDSLSAVYLLFVTGVSFLVHLYSIGYMWNDEGFSRFFSYLSLFVFFMIFLVLSSNLVGMFLGWEGVGLCSYLLIGFWWKDWLNARAGLKAFLANRVGDFGFILGVLIALIALGNLEYTSMKEAVGSLTEKELIMICLLLFCGALGKSAQGPLYLWLPDAMRGPTPVSALIHAATMVTAGVYMVSRLDFLFFQNKLITDIVFWTGAITSIFSGIFGLFENDIKRVLAYSTISQLGLMFCGASANYASGIFHTFEHSFFKALLFLTAGMIMHAFHGVTDIHEIRKHKPLEKGQIWASMIFWFVGALSMSGIFPFSGFWSKSVVLESVKEKFGTLHWSVLLLSSMITVLYIFRTFWIVFWGDLKTKISEVFKLRLTVSIEKEGGLAMFSAVTFLLILSAIGGIFSIETWLGNQKTHLPILEEIAIQFALFFIIFISYLMFKDGKDAPIKGIFIIFWKKFFIDDFETKSFVGSGIALGKIVYNFFEVNIIERIYWLITKISEFFSLVARVYHGKEPSRVAFFIIFGTFVFILLGFSL